MWRSTTFGGELALDGAQRAARLRDAARAGAELLDRLPARPRRVGHDALERRILAEDRLLQPPQLGPGLEPQLLDERPARLLEEVERLRLAAGAVEREHQQPAEALAQRVLVDERAQRADDLGVAARVEVALDRELRRPQVELLQPPRVRGRERLVAHVGERLAPPERERDPCELPRCPFPSSAAWSTSCSKRSTSTASGAIRSS